ncbi:MAG: hypothetical protein PVG07_11470 [Acidobacteriota bacterium]
MPSSKSKERLLDRFLPAWDAGRTDSLWVPAPPDRAYRAVMELPVEEVPLFRWMMRLRMLPGRLLGRRYAIRISGGLVKGFLDAGFVRLGERPGRELVIGAAGRFWRPLRFHPLAPLEDAAGFHAFREPGWAKAAFDVAVHPERDGARVTSEIRMAGTDPRGARCFRRYWKLICAPSGSIRRSALRAVRRRVR